MQWLILALASAFTFGIVSILDKIILMRYVRHPRTFIVLVGIIQFPMGLSIIPFAPIQSYPMGLMAFAFFSGTLWGFSLVAMFWAMSREDVSRVIPVMSISPVFVAIMAALFLSEDITLFHWIAILVTAAGAGLISLRTSRASGVVSFSPSILLLVLGSISLAGGQFTSKVVLEEMEMWNFLTIRSLGLGTVCILLMIRPSVIRDIGQVMKSPSSIALLVLTEWALVFVAIIFTLWAIDSGPVSLVATVMSTRPLFVFVFSVLLSSSLLRLLDEPLDRGTLFTKVVSTAMIVAGISAISLL